MMKYIALEEFEPLKAGPYEKANYPDNACYNATHVIPGEIKIERIILPDTNFTIACIFVVLIVLVLFLTNFWKKKLNVI